jgi:hypothetical protein
MLDHPQTPIARFAVEDSRPATFLERGVTVPFTTPFLLGARVRPAQRSGLELVVPNPAGVRGSYVFPFGALCEVCTPTLHDRLLGRAVEGAATITPEAITRIAREVAREGLAGREAAKAAGEAEEADRSQTLVTHYRLLLHLIEQSERPGEQAVPAARDSPARIEQRARRAIARVAAELSLTTEAVVTALEEIAGICTGIGFRGDPTRARYQRQIAELEVMAAEVASWAEAAADTEEAKASSLVLRCTELTLKCGRPLMGQLTALPDDMRGLIGRWSREPRALRELAARPAWLLDGWAALTGIWRTAGEAGRMAALREMAVLVPAMPSEVDAWAEGEAERFAAVHRVRSRFVFPLEEWRTGRALELVARNEKLLQQML